jgi:hypothetical protein
MRLETQHEGLSSNSSDLHGDGFGLPVRLRDPCGCLFLPRPCGALLRDQKHRPFKWLGGTDKGSPLPLPISLQPHSQGHEEMTPQTSRPGNIGPDAKPWWIAPPPDYPAAVSQPYPGRTTASHSSNPNPLDPRVEPEASPLSGTLQRDDVWRLSTCGCAGCLVDSRSPSPTGVSPHPRARQVAATKVPPPPSSRRLSEPFQAWRQLVEHADGSARSSPGPTQIRKIYSIVIAGPTFRTASMLDGSPLGTVGGTPRI